MKFEPTDYESVLIIDILPPIVILFGLETETKTIKKKD